MFFTSFLRQEFSYFKKLSADGQKLITSIFIYNLVNPILYTFVSAFIWRESHDMALVALYTAATWSMSPVGFYLNGLIIRKIPVRKIFAAGTVAQGLVAASLMFLKPTGVIPILLFGLVNGIFVGLYWSNRNFLTLRKVADEKQSYFFSLANASATLCSIVIPSVVGYFLVFGEQIKLYSSPTAYLFLGLIALTVLTLAGNLGKTISAGKEYLGRIPLSHPTKNWQRVRGLMLGMGAVNGLEMFLPSTLVLALVGNEKILGSILSATAIVSVIAIYLLGRKENLNLSRVLLAGTVITTLAGLNFGLFYSGLAVIIFMAANSIGNAFRWQAIIPLFYNSINRDENTGQNHHYSFVFDVEVMINLGRVVGIGIFLVALAKFPDWAARVVFPLLCLGQFVTYYFGRRIATTLKTLKPVPVEVGAEAPHEPEPLQAV